MRLQNNATVGMSLKRVDGRIYVPFNLHLLNCTCINSGFCKTRKSVFYLVNFQRVASWGLIPALTPT